MARIAVLMGVYNNAPTLSEAIDSLFAQTLPDWELIACDDGSTDGSKGILLGYQQRHPEKIRVLFNAENQGLNATLNRCLKAAAAPYIARQDGDDVSLPERFETEAALLDSRPDLALVSCGMALFDENGDWGQSLSVENPTAADFMRGSPFCHAPCMIRRAALETVGGYSDGAWLRRVEDYHLWYKLYRAGLRGMNINRLLYRARDGRDAENRRTLRNRLNECYVRLLCFVHLKPPVYTLPMVLRPLLVMLLPRPLYRRLHRQKLQDQVKA